MTASGDQRWYPEFPRASTDHRTPGQVDRDRLLYSLAFARLAEVTQVVSPENGHVFHNRLTHSLKVAQIARRLAEKLQYEFPDLATIAEIDPDCAEAAALAHDLGHPPHGHIAEEEIHKVAVRHGLSDGFEGNAQSFRIVCQLAVGSARDEKTQKPFSGLNLTRRTLNGILKYPWLYGANTAKPNKWGAYKTEKSIFDWVRSSSPSRDKGVIAEIMDIADDITYAVHDLTDFIAANKIPIESLVAGGAEREAFYADVFRRHGEWGSEKTELTKRMDRVFGMFVFDRRYVGDLKDQQALWRLTSLLISRFINEISLAPDPTTKGSVCVEMPPGFEREIRMLKELMWTYVILGNDLLTEQHGQKRAVQETLEIMLTAVAQANYGLFPPTFQQLLSANTDSDPSERKRLAVDYIAGMTERELATKHSLLTRS
jgi:dGTPase